MSATREQVFGALLDALTAGVPGMNTYTRRMTLPGAIPSGDLPSLMIREEHEETVQKGNLPNRVWNATIFLVFNNPSKTVPGATIIDPLIEMVEATLAPDGPGRPFHTFTLGGLVHYCRIAGTTLKETGDTDTDGLGGAAIPISIRVP